ncbi:hypothetical protein [Pyxidicoccus fallax]|uniref:hypothetical protein n=1 Tax=Pyxidicoccus fallax TaxID=394095 RepID=UPI0031B59E2A
MALLAVLLTACGSARHVAPPPVSELSRFVLFIRELPDGTVTHSWRRADELDLSQYRIQARSRSTARRIQPVVAQPRDCDEENRECIRKCMSRELKELQVREFTTVDSAVDWLKRNREEVLVGSVVVVAGVAFVVLSAGAALIVLAPAVLLADPATASEPRMAEVSP